MAQNSGSYSTEFKQTASFFLFNNIILLQSKNVHFFLTVMNSKRETKVLHE